MTQRNTLLLSPGKPTRADKPPLWIREIQLPLSVLCSVSQWPVLLNCIAAGCVRPLAGGGGWGLGVINSIIGGMHAGCVEQIESNTKQVRFIFRRLLDRISDCLSQQNSFQINTRLSTLANKCYRMYEALFAQSAWSENIWMVVSVLARISSPKLLNGFILNYLLMGQHLKLLDEFNFGSYWFSMGPFPSVPLCYCWINICHFICIWTLFCTIFFKRLFYQVLCFT
jgi:hypothetical protein